MADLTQRTGLAVKAALAAAPAVDRDASLPTESLEAYASHRQRLFDEGLLVPTGVDGVYGRSGRFEQVVSGLQQLVASVARDLDATVYRFPPVAARASFVATDYLRSFPDMAGDVESFAGDDRAHRLLLERLEEGRPWADLLSPTETVLCPAVCHPLYPTLSPSVAPDGRYFDVCGYVFRHEPSVDPARMMSFRQYDIVYVGTPDGARTHRDRSLERALELLSSIGIEVTSSLANDPFFGRAGKILAKNQRVEELKYEVLAPTSPVEQPTAIASANCHEDHFGSAFGLRLPDGEPAHTACVGYGLERITLALLWVHGTDVDRWPPGIRGRLWP